MDKAGRGEGGSITIFFQKNFCLTVPKNFSKEPFNVPRVSKKFMLKEVMSRSSVDFFLSHSAEKFLKGTL